MFVQFSKPCLIVAFSLTPPVKPLVKQVSQLIFKAAEASPVPCHTVIVIVANQLPIQFSKQYLLRQTAVLLKSATRLTAPMAAVEAGLKGASVSITQLGRTLSGPACIKHKIKRIDRLAGNHHLNTERMAVYGAKTQWLLQSLPMPLILIDWSPLTADQHQQLLRAALPTGGRSVTLYEEIHPIKKLGNRRIQQRFLSSFQALLPANVTPIIVADFGFRTPFFREVESLGWHWLGRIRNRDFIAWANRPNDWLAAKSLYAKATQNRSAWARPIGCAAIR